MNRRHLLWVLALLAILFVWWPRDQSPPALANWSWSPEASWKDSPSAYARVFSAPRRKQWVSHTPLQIVPPEPYGPPPRQDSRSPLAPYKPVLRTPPSQGPTINQDPYTTQEGVQYHDHPLVLVDTWSPERTPLLLGPARSQPAEVTSVGVITDVTPALVVRTGW